MSEFKLPRAEMHIVDHCNLNCKGCWHYAPLAKPKFYNLEQFKIEIAQLSKFFNCDYGDFRILGGEPLLHPQVLDFCTVARHYFRHVNLTTNGLLLYEKNDDFFNTINSLDITIVISNYKEDDKLANLVETKCKHYLIVDKPQMINLRLDFFGSKTSVAECPRCSWVTIKDGYIYRCFNTAWVPYLFKYFNFKPINYNINDNRISLLEATSEKLEQFFESESTFCKYCIGDRYPAENYTWDYSKKDITEWVASLEKTTKLKG